MAWSLHRGAESGAMTWQATPKFVAHHANPWPKFPADAVQTPCARTRAWSASAMALEAGRHLNEPIGCSDSSLR